jgi:hypothetical protein
MCVGGATLHRRIRTAAHSMGTDEARRGFSGRFQASPWQSIAPRHRHTSLLRVALLLLDFFYINDRHRHHFPFSPPLPTSSPAGEIHRRPAIIALSISPKASPHSCASPKLDHSRSYSPHSPNRHHPPQVRQSAIASRLVVAGHLHYLSVSADCSTALTVSR